MDSLFKNILNMNENKELIEEEDNKYKLDGFDVISIHYLKDPIDDYENIRNSQDSNYNKKPLFIHQIFESEFINGYEKLTIDLFINYNTMDSLLKINYDNKLEDACDLYEELDKFFECKMLYYKNEEDKVKFNDSFKIKINKIEYAKLLNSITTNNKNYEIYFVEDIQNEEFNKFLNKFRIIIKFYIEKGSYIDTNSKFWRFLLIFENNNENKLFVGFKSIYNFYYNYKIFNSRISQIIILPTYRKNRLPYELLTTYHNLMKDTDCNLITIEDPTEEYKIIRNIFIFSYIKSRINPQELTNIDDFETFVNNWNSFLDSINDLKLSKSHLNKLKIPILIKLINNNPDLESKINTLIINYLGDQCKNNYTNKPIYIDKKLRTVDQSIIMNLSIQSKIQNEKISKYYDYFKEISIKFN